MMKKILVRVVLGLVILIVGCIGAVYAISSMKLAARYDVPVASIETSTDSVVIAHGARVAQTRGCLDCHGQDLSGSHFFDAMPVASIWATNLTSGANGVGATYSDEDFVRAIRSGVRPDGSPLLIMPSHEYRPIGPEDLGALVSWIKSMPPVDTEPVDQTLGPVARVLYITGQAPIVPAELIDHDDPTFEQPEVGVSVEYGAYLAVSCIGCHGESFVGGPIPGFPPDFPAAANLTPHEEAGLGGWSRDDFERFAETGITPDGLQLEPMYMPWPLLQAMTDVERDAVWLFLRSLPAAAQPE